MNQALNPAQGHINNFDFLRLLFATLVLYSHSYALTGLPVQDVLWHFAHGQVEFSLFAVRGFFAISGYLILKSLLWSASLREYGFKRIIRLFPALWLVIGVTLIGAYFLSGMPLRSYLTNHSVHLYFLNLVLRLHTGIDGVFEHNPFPVHINGSLWTVPYEMLWYILLTPLFFIRRHLTLLRVTLLLAFGGLVFLRQTGLSQFTIHDAGFSPEQAIFLGTFFVGGALLSLFPLLFRSSRIRTGLVAGSGLALVGVFYWGGFDVAQLFLVPVFVIAFGTSNYPSLSWIRNYGDISYGVYIWGFPIQQTLAHFLHPTQPVMAVLSISIAWALGFASWHLLEKRALLLKLKSPVAQSVPVAA